MHRPPFKAGTAQIEAQISFIYGALSVCAEIDQEKFLEKNYVPFFKKICLSLPIFVNH
jgi:hypothetical protein